MPNATTRGPWRTSHASSRASGELAEARVADGRVAGARVPRSDERAPRRGDDDEAIMDREA